MAADPSQEGRWSQQHTHLSTGDMIENQTFAEASQDPLSLPVTGLFQCLPTYDTCESLSSVDIFELVRVH